MRTMVEVECNYCKKQILREKCEVDKNNRKGFKTHCNRECSKQAHTTPSDLIECYNCKKQFTRKLYEIKQNEHKKYRFFCSRTCSFQNKDKYLERGSDKLAPFKELFSRAKKRIKEGHSFSITLEGLKEQWDSQCGICPYTGMKMEIDKHTQDRADRLPNKASLDRIDSRKGYTPDNIDFVCMSVNFAKSTFSKKEMMDFFKPVRTANSMKRVKTTLLFWI